MTAKTRSTTGAVLLALTMLVAACGSPDDSTSGGGAGDVDQSSEGSAEAARRSSGSDDRDASNDAVEAEPGEALDVAAEEAMDDASAQRGLRSSTPAADGGVTASDSAGSGFFAEPTERDAVDAGEANTFEDYGVRPFVSTDRDPLSTFALDVDTASYSVAKQWLDAGSLPPPESVRVEEYVNSFDYDYLAPRRGLNVQADGGPSPYDAGNIIVRLGVQAERVASADRPNASLTFVVDTSGSMDRAGRLGLVKTALSRLSRELSPDDTVAIVTYSDEAEVILAPTPAADLEVILDAIARLRPDGSTNLEAGLAEGYALADRSFQPGGINRVVLASDGVANVGLTDPDGLARSIRDDADRGIQLVTVGVGMGNFNDVVMEQLADQGDGFYAYVDDEAEADRLFGDELVSTLLTVALDGKIQVEFNADVVERYRLIGFENRAVLDDDFRNDAVDAGELGAGHQVTALYELTLRSDVGRDGSSPDQLGTVQLRWEDPEERSVVETRLVLTSDVVEARWTDTDPDFRLAVTVAAFAEVLRNSPHVGDITLRQVAEEAEALSSGSGPVEELVRLIEQAEARYR